MTPALHADARGFSLLDQAIGHGGLTAVFQPLVRLDTLEVVAHEGLSRPASGPEGLTILDLLDLARAKGRLGEFELHAARVVCDAFSAQNGSGRLLINLSAQAILHGGLLPNEVVTALSASGLDLCRITIELTERDIVENPAELADAIGYLRARGVRVALDDFGNGHSNFQMWNEVHPEVVKIDRYLIDGLAHSAERLAIVQAICRVAETLGSDLVGEGVENPADLRMMRELGICYAQGFLLGRPSPTLTASVTAEALEAIREHALSVPPRPRGPVAHRPMHAGHLIIHAPTVTQAQSNDDVAAIFAREPSLHAIAVVDVGRPIGLINRRVFTEGLAQPFARELFGRKSCATFMHETPLLCDERQPVEGMADILRGEDQRYLTDGFVITQAGRYLGLGTGESLVRRVTEHRIEAARYANPLTFLPGNIPVTEHITRLLRGKRPFVAAYADLNDFKPFNDQYGYFRGDKMIRLLADILTAQVDPAQDFVGHIGGDDFLVLFQSEDWEQRCERVIAQFNERACALFDPQDLVRGGIDGEDRRGLAQFFPLTTIAIGAVRLKLPFPRRAETIATLAARAKRRAKRERLGLHVIASAEAEPMRRAFV
ncbi:GGDEF domain-containing protein [Rhodanobacter sp. MP7CTX1]|uniref:GGDEF domain-containing protein n=1 Tax=Rhodanobacter sp. MP7CTX1 TaxID=2723084 RepID=UPI001621F7D0|nr:GGDEF domain-containing protein [Rhodanobacter sp. MP7CTX1]MBB6189349.1 EAL domain-containing protein (putative c-di-GMP-specific phosphodiesterase class I)/GGDEF domain-containing protein [Rhodanobacter sp. MP7CTX1]